MRLDCFTRLRTVVFGILGVSKNLDAEVATTTRATWRNVLHAFAPGLWPHRATLAGSYSAGLLAIGAGVLAPWPLKIIIDNVLGGAAASPALSAFVVGWSAEQLVLALAAAAAVIASCEVMLSGLEKNLNARVRERMGLELRDRLLAHVHTLPLNMATTHRSGEVVMRLVSDVTLVVRLLTKTAPTIFTHVVTTLAVLAIMFWLEPLMGALGIVAVVVLVWLTRFYVHPLREASRDKRHGEGNVSGLAQEIMRGLPSVQALRAEAQVRERFVEVNRKSLAAGVEQTRVAVGLERTLGVAKGVTAGLIVGGGALLVLRNQLTLGELTVCAAYVNQLLKPVSKINELATSIARSLTRGEQLLGLLAIEPAVKDQPDARAVHASLARLELRSVSFAYPEPAGRSAVYVLRDVDLVLEPGSFTVLAGESGGGKSTLLRLLLRLFDPSSGELLFDGIPYRAILLASLRSQFAVMLQDTHLFAGRVRDVLQPPDGPQAERELWRALAEVAMSEFISGLPDGLDAPLGEDGLNLSGGQRARLSLARALLLKRPVLLLDEPLANVDQDSQRIIVDTLTRTRGQHTCLAVSHQPALAACADVVMHLKQGCITPVATSPRHNLSALTVRQ